MDIKFVNLFCQLKRRLVLACQLQASRFLHDAIICFSPLCSMSNLPILKFSVAQTSHLETLAFRITNLNVPRKNFSDFLLSCTWMLTMLSFHKYYQAQRFLSFYQGRFLSSWRANFVKTGWVPQCAGFFFLEAFKRCCWERFSNYRMQVANQNTSR
jgi:hypothetical protein